MGKPYDRQQAPATTGTTYDGGYAIHGNKKLTDKPCQNCEHYCSRSHARGYCLQQRKMKRATQTCVHYAAKEDS